MAKKRNRSTTYESLCACVGLLLAEDKETFRQYYLVAIHDDNGGSIWSNMNREYIKRLNKNKRMRKQNLN